MRFRRPLLSALLVLVLLLAGCASTKREPRFEPAPEDFLDAEEDWVEEESPPSSGPAPSSSSSSAPPQQTQTTRPSSGPPPPPPPPGPASPPRTWASPEAARIRPGASLDDGSCTANFIFTSPDNSTVYIGTAAHCFTTSGATETNGCLAGTRDLGETMDVNDAGTATLVYSSWVTMQAVEETNPHICDYNDFALLQLDEAAAALVSPAMEVYGGPVGLADPAAIQDFDKVLTYGNSGLRPQDSPLSPKEGYVWFAPGDSWTMDIYTVTPGIPGDSGSGVLTADGQAIGDLVTVSIFGTNGVSILSHQLDYARTHGFDVRLATWELLSDGNLP